MGVFMTINEMLGRGTWPPAALQATWAEVELFAALRTSNSDRLRQERWINWRQDYLISPVPRMISRASAHMLFGEPALIAPEADADEQNLERIIDENDLPSELHRAAVIASSEGEVWGRIVVDASLLDVPIIEFVSRDRVIPHFAGRFLIGATFVTTWVTGTTERYRLFETYEAGLVTSVLYRGTTTSLGSTVKLDKFDATKGRQEHVLTGVEWPLAVFIPNSIDSKPARGFSDYAGMTDRFFAINESVTIGQSNMRLAGRKRALIDSSYVNGNRSPEGDDIFIRHSRHTGDDAKSPPPLSIIEYGFEAEQTIAWVDHLVDSSLTFAGISPQSVGRQIDGSSLSGTAMRLRMSHSLLEAAGKGRYMDKGIRKLLRAATVIDGRPIGENGFGRTYAQRDALPSIERWSGVPRDDAEAAAQLTNMVAAEAISVEQRVRWLHPDWTEQKIADEVKALEAEHQAPVLEEPRL